MSLTSANVNAASPWRQRRRVTPSQVKISSGTPNSLIRATLLRRSAHRLHDAGDPPSPSTGVDGWRYGGRHDHTAEPAPDRTARHRWIQHSDAHLEHGSDQWRIVPELTPDAAEPHVDKHYLDAFEETSLEAVLADLGVGRIFVTGAQTDACIRSTLHGALTRGYDTALVRDAHTTRDRSQFGVPGPGEVIAHTNLYWTHQTAPGRTAGTVATAEVDFHA
ncbi:hypothetical protein F4553_000428 [Allocatelliglobosispora scoriae]|uniref:Isochorismatase-like domain-containing protein n=1 Tax=Allocatelliglobosispora scoriae TaxID=643052 RepID=A0A841BIQ5_9ACTN|nr:isochorismatase family protein [Allocatelliglobosispora scoriae]MBB5867049.1 hypothetical protein [Allocatelliglobosispora scoriae]